MRLSRASTNSDRLSPDRAQRSSSASRACRGSAFERSVSTRDPALTKIDEGTAQPDESPAGEELPHLGHQRQQGSATAPDRDVQKAVRAKEGKAAGAVEDNSGTTAEVDDGAAGADDLSPSDDDEDGDDDEEAEGDAAAVNGVNGADATAKPGRRKRAKAKVRRRKLCDADSQLSRAKASVKAKTPGLHA